jgi:GT2 family glycosyltransferase
VTQIRLSAVVLAYGPDELLTEALAALRAALNEVAGPTELIVVLNRISGHNRTELERSGDVVLLDPRRNLGFAAGVNAGIARATGEWIALVNDDCIVEPSSLAELLAAGEASADIGSVAAQIRFADRPGTINSAGIDVDVLGIATERLLGAPTSRSETQVTEVFGASGAAALYRRAMLDEIAGFDESFFAYLEDADVAWRARMAGWRCVYAPAAVARHHHSSSLGHGSPEKHFLVGRNRIRMLAKNATRAQLLRYGPLMLAYDISYVTFVAFTARTAAPVLGRYRGSREWGSARKASQGRRRSITLSAPPGLIDAYGRWNIYKRRLAAKAPSGGDSAGPA